VAVLVLALLSPTTGRGQASLASSPAAPSSADLVLRRGAIYTVDASRSWAESLAIRGGRIVYVGADQGIESWIGTTTAVVELDGKMVLPGFHDSHVHLVGGGVEVGECNLNGLTTLEEVLKEVQRYAAAHPTKPWIRGGGWPLTLADGNPHKMLLDQIVADRPVFLDAFDGHSSWVNSRALELAGIDRSTPDPPRGRIERDAAGEPTGTLRESAARLVLSKAPPYTDEDYLAGLRRGLEMANRLGITSVQEASCRDFHLRAFDTLSRRGELTVRAVASLRVDPERPQAAQIAQFVDWRTRFASPRFRPTAVKIFLDGVIESKTAALSQPYLGSQDRGWLNLEPDVLKPLAVELDRLGFQIHVHAIGDRAIHEVLDALQFARQQNGARDSRHHIAHIQLFEPEDIPRFRRLGVVANFQPLWASADEYIVKMTEPVLGPERSRWLYPIRSLVESGAVIVGGSDWSVTSMNPLEAIQVAVTRRGIHDGPGPAWLPEETVDLSTMIAAYTIQGAYLSFQETTTGSLEVGKAADLVVLDQNLFDVPRHELHRVKVLWTLLDGQPVYRAAEFPAH